MDISIDRSGKTPAYRQVYLQMRKDIESGSLKAGDKLPKIRDLAHDLGIARNTVEAAYKQLSIEGYAFGKRGTGYIVEELNLSILDACKASENADDDPRSSHDARPRREPLGNSFGCTYVFSYGNRTSDKLPISTLKTLIDRTLSQEDLTEAASYIDPYGLPDLRRQFSSHLHKTRDIVCSYEQVILQPGTQAALHKIVSVFRHDKRPIALENPGYNAARKVFEERAEAITPIPVSKGQDAFIDALRASNAKLVFLTPSKQFPLGFIMPLSTRLKVIEWARETGAYIIEDDYCYEFRYNSQPVPSLRSLDPDHVIYLGTMSKVFTPAIRISFMVLPKKLQRHWDESSRFDLCSLPWLSQKTLALFMASDAWRRYVRTTVAMYKKRHDLLVKSIEREMGDKVTVMGVDAGLHLLIGDNEGRDQNELINLARENDVRVYGTSGFWAEESHPMRNFVLIGYSGIQDELIPSGISKLAHAWY